MIELKTVLVPTDFSEHAMEALPYAWEIARALGAEIVLAHACSSEAGVPAARRRLEELTRSRVPQSLRAVVGVGSPADFLIRLAEQSEHTLMLLCTRGRRGLSRRVLGSTAEELVSRAPCPILTVKELDGELMAVAPSKPGESVRRWIPRILVATDFSPTSDKGILYAAEFARAFSSEVFVLHVLPGEGLVRDHVRSSSAWRFLEQVSHRLDPAPHKALLATGSPARVIVSAARTHAVNLVIMGTRGLVRRAGVRQRSVARAVVRRAPCPVLAVKDHEHEILGRGSREVLADLTRPKE